MTGSVCGKPHHHGRHVGAIFLPEVSDEEALHLTFLREHGAFREGVGLILGGFLRQI